MVDPRAAEAFMKISRVALPLILGFVGYLIFAQFASRPAYPQELPQPEVTTDISAKFKTAWRNTGPKPVMPADDAKTAAIKMQLRWIGIGKCEPPECEP